MEKLLEIPHLREFFNDGTKDSPDIVAMNSSKQGQNLLKEFKRLQDLNDPLALFRVNFHFNSSTSKLCDTLVVMQSLSNENSMVNQINFSLFKSDDVIVAIYKRESNTDGDDDSNDVSNASFATACDAFEEVNDGGTGYIASFFIDNYR